MSAKRSRWWSRKACPALDAAELVAVEYEELPAVVDAREAIKPDAPHLFDDIPGNLALDWPGPVDDPANVAAIDEIIASAAHVARVTSCSSAW